MWEGGKEQKNLKWLLVWPSLMFRLVDTDDVDTVEIPVSLLHP